ncbi:MAG: methionyl-tRNA formyltransferase, partial [Ignavibacteriales bacterium]|nr:methionyl-tRNA formyltransferase [Ignavibacteriales bacterium]
MTILFMGTPEFALPSLRILLEHGYQIPGVVTAPDKPQGRGQKVALGPVKRFALENSLPVFQPENLNDRRFIDEIARLRTDLIVVVAFRILPPEVYQLARLGAFNLHASLLPKYRGAAPIHWAIINGEQETGVTTFFLRETVDTGSIVLQARVRIGADETAGELHDKLADVG